MNIDPNSMPTYIVQCINQIFMGYIQYFFQNAISKIHIDSYSLFTFVKNMSLLYFVEGAKLCQLLLKSQMPSESPIEPIMLKSFI